MGSKLFGRGAVANVFDGGDNHLDGEKCHLVVDNDENGCGDCPDKASHIVRGVEEGSAKSYGDCGGW